MRFSNINDLVEGLMKDVEHEKKGKKTLSTKEKALRKALTESKNAIDRNNHRGGKKLADYRRSFEELLESYYPGKPWYQITSVNIDNEFANGTTPEQLITKLVENIKVDKVKSTNKSTTHTKLNESKSSKRLTEGSLASKAKAVVQKLRGDVEEDGMYEELDYDDFELEEAYSEIDDIDEGCVCEGRNADRARKALKRIQGGMNEDLPDSCTGKGCRCKGTLNGPTDDEIGLNEGNETGTPLSVKGKTVLDKMRATNPDGKRSCLTAENGRKVVNQLRTGTPLSVKGKKVLDQLRGGMNEDLPDSCTGKGCRCKGTLNGPTDDEIGLQEGGIANKVRAKIKKLRGGMNEELPDGCKGKGCGCKGTLNGPTDDETGLKESAPDGYYDWDNWKQRMYTPGKLKFESTDEAIAFYKENKGKPVTNRFRNLSDFLNNIEITVDPSYRSKYKESLPDRCKGKGCGCKGTLNGPTKDETGLKESKRAKRFDPKAIAEEYGLTCESDEYGCNNFCNGDECVASFDDEEFADVEDPEVFLRGELDAVMSPSDDEFDDEEWDDDYIPDDDGYIPDDDGYVPDEEGYMPEGLADTARSKAKKLRSITGGR